MVHEVLAKEVSRVGITYAELSRRCGINREALRLSLAGSRKFTAEELVTLSRYFGLEMSDFYEAA